MNTYEDCGASAMIPGVVSEECDLKKEEEREEEEIWPTNSDNHDDLPAVELPNDRKQWYDNGKPPRPRPSSS